MANHPIMSDTLIACCGSIGHMLPYMRGEYAPHYPVPVLREHALVASEADSYHLSDSDFLKHIYPDWD